MIDHSLLLSAFLQIKSVKSIHVVEWALYTVRSLVQNHTCRDASCTVGPGQGGLERVALLWTFHCAFCVLYHVIGSCKGLLIGRSSTVHTSVLHITTPPPPPPLTSPSFLMNNMVFNWKSDFNLSDHHLREFFSVSSFCYARISC